MNNRAATEIKNKPFSWWGFELFLVIIGFKIAGIAGGIGFYLIAYGLEKITTNTKYSRNKKIFYSVLYGIAGIGITIILTTIITLIISNYFGTTILSKTNIEQSYRVPQGYQIYKNPKTKWSSIAYPNNWTVEENLDEFYLIFKSPDKKRWITATLFLQDENDKIDLKTYTTNAFSDEVQKKEPGIKFQKTAEQIKNINGKDWLIYDSIVTINHQATYDRTAMVITGKYDGREVIRFLMESDQEHFQTDTTIFDTMIESARFYK